MFKNILVTGASGYVGSLVIKKLAENKTQYQFQNIVGTDVRPMREKIEGIDFEKMDIRDVEIEEVLKKYSIDCIIHLASVVTPPKNSNRDFEYSIDVLGTKNLLYACLRQGVKRIIISSSGAAYGYYADNPEWLKETDAIRGNYEFPYSYHKRLIEEELEKFRRVHPELEQTIFRIGTVLGDKVNNQITDLFKKPVQIGIKGSKTPFVFIWDQDVVDCLIYAVTAKKTGIFNLAGDGALTIDERAKMMKKKVVYLSATAIEKGLKYLKQFQLSQYGPEQVNFIRYRPVLDNKKLKDDFGYIPKKTSKEVFELFVKNLN